MDSPRTHAAITAEFRTPVRILLPKLLHSRDQWKRKCHARRRQNKALQITVRDLTASRDAWRAKYEQLLGQHHPRHREREPARAQKK